MADKPDKPPISKEEWEKAQEGWDAAKRAAGAIPPLPPKNSNADPPGVHEVRAQIQALQDSGTLDRMRSALSPSYWVNRMDREDRRRNTEAAIEQSERPSETKTTIMAEGSWTSDDWAVAAIGALVAVPLCEAGWHAVVNEPEHFARGIIAICVGLPLGLAGFSYHRWKTKIPAAARKLIGEASLKWWPVAIFLAFLYFAGPDIYRRAIEQVPPAPPVAQPQQQSFGFAPSSTSVPSKLYSEKEKQALLNLIGTISEELNDKGLPAARLAQTTGGNLVTPSKDGLNDAFIRGSSVIKTLSDVQRVIWNEILQPENSNFLNDLNYVVGSNAQFDQFQRATDRFTGTIENFQRNLNSFNVDQRNWIASLIQIGPGQVWNQSAGEFQAWIQQCNARMDKERDGLK